MRKKDPSVVRQVFGAVSLPISERQKVLIAATHEHVESRIIRYRQSFYDTQHLLGGLPGRKAAEPLAHIIVNYLSDVKSAVRKVRRSQDYNAAHLTADHLFAKATEKLAFMPQLRLTGNNNNLTVATKLLLISTVKRMMADSAFIDYRNPQMSESFAGHLMDMSTNHIRLLGFRADSTAAALELARFIKTAMLSDVFNSTDDENRMAYYLRDALNLTPDLMLRINNPSYDKPAPGNE